jgi:hypothetical protein
MEHKVFRDLLVKFRVLKVQLVLVFRGKVVLKVYRDLLVLLRVLKVL